MGYLFYNRLIIWEVVESVSLKKLKEESLVNGCAGAWLSFYNRIFTILIEFAYDKEFLSPM